MKKKNRQVNIFSISTLDLFASAMGVFLVIAVISLPYYLKSNKKIEKEFKILKKQNEQISKKLAQAQKENNSLKKSTFCVIKMEWKSKNTHDVDLYVTDANANVFFYKQPKIKGDNNSLLTVDAGYPKLTNSGAEIWLTKKLKKGTYTIEYAYAKGTPPVEVYGTILTKTLEKKMPKKVFYESGKIKVATINIDKLGNVSINTF